MNPIELPISARLDTGDALAKAQALTAEADRTAKAYDKAARAAKRLADRMQGAAAATGGAAPGGSSFGGGSGGSGSKAVKVTGDTDFFDRLGKSLMRMRPSYIGANMAMGNTRNLGRMGVQSLLEAIGGGGGVGLLGLLGAAGVGVGAGALAINKAQTDFTRQQMLLSSALTGGPNLGSATARGLQISSAGQVYNQWPAQMQGWAQTLAQAGVSGRNVRGGNQLLGTLANTAAFAGAHGMDPSTLMPLAGSLTTQGGMGQDALNRTYQDLGNVAKDSDVSVSQLLDSMKVLSKTATGAAKDVLGLAAVQHMVGASSGINVGALMSPVLSAQGGQALAASAFLGLSQGQFIGLQNSKGGSAKLFDLIAQKIKPMAAAGPLPAEALLQGLGLLDMSQVNTGQAAQLVKTMETQGGDAAYKQYQKYTADTSKQTTSETTSLKHWSSQIDNSTDVVKKFTVAIQNATNWFINGGPGTNGGPKTPPGADTTTTDHFSYNQSRLNNYKLFGMQGVKNAHGSADASSQVVQQAWAASKGNPQLFALMMAQMSQESGFNASAIQKGVPESQRGYGIAQFTATLGDGGLKKYLGSSDPSVWHKRALNQRQSIDALGAYDTDLLAQAHGDPKKAAAMYNAGPNVTSSAYGNSVGGVAQQIEGKLDVTVTVKDGHGNVHDKQKHKATVTQRKGTKKLH